MNLYDNQIFVYVDGDPLKGKWIDLDLVDGWDDIKEELAEGGFIPRNAEGEPDYGGDMLVADYEGPLAKVCYGKYGTFDMDEFMAARDSKVDQEIYAAWVSHQCQHPSDPEQVLEDYIGEFESDEDMAANFIEDTGYLDEMPERLRYYFDYAKYANDMRLSGDFFKENYHYFWNR